jgi:hypothetical protein
MPSPALFTYITDVRAQDRAVVLDLRLRHDAAKGILLIVLQLVAVHLVTMSCNYNDFAQHAPMPS